MTRHENWDERLAWLQSVYGSSYHPDDHEPQDDFYFEPEARVPTCMCGNCGRLKGSCMCDHAEELAHLMRG